MMLCPDTLNSFLDLASVLTTSTISINDTTYSWCLHLFQGDPTAGHGLIQDDLVRPDGNTPAWSCIDSPLKLFAVMLWWVLHRALMEPRKPDGELDTVA